MEKTLKSYVQMCLFKLFTLVGEYSNRIVWVGNYDSWDRAMSSSLGYNNKNVLERVRDSLIKVKRGEAVYERDSVVFYTVEYQWPLLAALYRIASENGNRLSILDFGGSLGSTYFQNKGFLIGLDSLKWCIVEQPHFVECGKDYFENESLLFFDDIVSCVATQRPDVVLLSSVLAYLERPYDVLDLLSEVKIEWIIIDRTFFLTDTEEDRLTIQNVPSSVYKASYPCWFFAKKKLLRYFNQNYELVAEWHSIGKANINSRSLGLFYRLR